MKFTKKQLLDHHDIMSHVFFNCIGNHETEIFKKVQNLDEVELELFIEGEKVEVEPFFNMLWKQYNDYVKEAAKELLSGRNTEIIDELRSDLFELKERIEYHTEIIDWDKPNPFLKEKNNERK